MSLMIAKFISLFTHKILLLLQYANIIAIIFIYSILLLLQYVNIIAIIALLD